MRTVTLPGPLPAETTPPGAHAEESAPDHSHPALHDQLKCIPQLRPPWAPKGKADPLPSASVIPPGPPSARRLLLLTALYRFAVSLADDAPRRDREPEPFFRRPRPRFGNSQRQAGKALRGVWGPAFLGLLQRRWGRCRRRPAPHGGLRPDLTRTRAPSSRSSSPPGASRRARPPGSGCRH